MAKNSEASAYVQKNISIKNSNTYESYIAQFKMFKRTVQGNKQYRNIYIKSTNLAFKNNIVYAFTRYCFKGGLSLKALNYLHSSINKVFDGAFEDIENKKKKFSNFFFIISMMQLNASFFNINFFIFWLVQNISYNFFFKVTTLPKFLKKKLGRKYAVEPIFLEKKKRIKLALRVFSLNIDADKAFLFKKRLFNSFKDLAFNFKKSRFFLEKINIYLKIFKLLKKKKNV